MTAGHSEQTAREALGGVRTPVADRPHPVHHFAGRLLDAIDGLTESSLFGLSLEHLAETTVELQLGLSKLHGLGLSILAHADRADVASLTDATSTAGWLRDRLPLTGSEAARQVKLAQSLDTDIHAPTLAALTAGEVLADQAAVIVAAVDALPTDLSVEERHHAETHLLGLAPDHDAKALKALGRHLLEVIDPDRAEASLGRQLEAEETRAARRTDLRMSFDGHGSVHGRFVIPELHGQCCARRSRPWRTRGARIRSAARAPRLTARSRSGRPVRSSGTRSSS